MLKACYQHEWIEAGCDEAGRGPLAGPVTAAAVILPPGWNHPLLNDSKKMSEKNRNLLRTVIEQEAVAWAVEMVMPEEIDRINILNASFAAMSRAVTKLETPIAADRRKPVPLFPGHSLSVHRQRRRHLRSDRSSFGTCQNLPRRIYDADRGRIPGLQVGTKQRLSYPRTPGSCHAPRSFTVPSPLF